MIENLFYKNNVLFFNCFKAQDESSSDIAMIAGIAAGGGICLAFVVIVFVYFRKYYKYGK